MQINLPNAHQLFLHPGVVIGMLEPLFFVSFLAVRTPYLQGKNIYALLVLSVQVIFEGGGDNKDIYFLAVLYKESKNLSI